MPAYLPVLKLYQSDGTTLDTAIYSGGVIPIHQQYPSFSWSVYGGCVSGKVMILRGSAATAAIRAAFPCAKGQFVKAFLLDGDTTPIWTGVVEDVSREIGNHYHEVTLRGLWDMIEIDVTEDVTVGSQATGTVTVGGSPANCNTFDTVGKVVKFLMDKYVVPASVGISYSASDIVCTVPRALMKIRAGTSIKRLLAELALMGESTNIGGDGLVVASPTRIAYGVDGAGAFFFRAIPDTILNTTTFGTSLIRGGRERAAGTGAVQQVVVVGSKAAVDGVQAKRAYRYAGASGRVLSRTIAVRSPYEADIQRAAKGWQSRYSAPPISVEGIAEIQAAPSAMPLPWNGKLRWTDPGRPGGALTIDSHFSSIQATLGRTLQITAEMGIGAGESREVDGGDDPYAPSALDAAIEGTEAAVIADVEEEAAECSIGIVGDTDYPGVDPPDDEPAMVTAEEAAAIPTVISDVSTLQTDVGNLETAVGTYAGAADLSTDLAAAESDIDTLQGDVAALDGRLDTAEADIAALEAAPTPITVTGMLIPMPSYNP